MRSLRLSLLGLIAGVLRRWLDAVTAQLPTAADAPAPPTAPAAPADARQPEPPDHWVELVRQHAPQLLDSEAAGNGNVIDWRSDEVVIPAPVALPARKARPLRLQMPRQRPAAALPTVKTASRRPLRMEQIAAQPLDAGEISERTGTAASREVPPPLRRSQPGDVPEVNRVSSDLPEAPTFPPRRAANAPAQPIHQVSSLPDEAEAVTPHFANAPFERQIIRETSTSLPKAADVPSIRTRPAGSGQPARRSASVPPAPPQQLVLRPTIIPSPLSVEDVSADRWPSLPDEPAEEVRDSSNRQRRERLRREQEGRTWNV